MAQAPLGYESGQDPSRKFIGEMTDAQFASSPTFLLVQQPAKPYSLSNVGTYKGSTAEDLNAWFSQRGELRPSISQMASLFEALGLGSAGTYNGTQEQQRSVLSALQTRSGGGSYSRPPDTMPPQVSGSTQIQPPVSQDFSNRPLGSTSSTEQERMIEMRRDPRYAGTNDEVLLGIIRGTSSPQPQQFSQQQYGGGTSGGYESGQQPPSGDQQNPQDVSGLNALGFDTAGWSPQQISYANMFLQLQKINADKNKPIVPLTTAELNQYLEDAKTELGPYYAEVERFGRRDFLQAFSNLTGETQAQEAAMRQQFPEQFEQLRSQAEMSGLADSGLRQRAEAVLKERQKGIVESTRRKTQSDLYALGAGYERRFGTQGIQQAGVPSFQSGAFETAGLTPQQIAYAPEPIPALGELAKQREVSTRERAAGLGAEEINRRRAVLGYI